VSWEDQGRDELGRFGDGKAPEKSKDTSGDGGMFSLGGLSQRIQAVAYGSIGALPQGLRARASARYDTGNLARLTEAMTAWIDGTRLSNAEFADRFFGRTADDPVVENREASRRRPRRWVGHRHAELREAAEKVADAMKTIGLDSWSRFLADAQDRARDPETVAAIKRSQQPPDPGRDAIRPVYPVETAIGFAAAIMTGGSSAGARVAGGALLRQILPKAGSRTGNAAEESAAGAANAEEPANKGEEGFTPTEVKRPSLPANPDDLLAQGWNETSHPGAAKLGHRTFENPKTGEIIRFDKGRPGEPGFEGKDHYHRPNPNKTGKHDEYLDLSGNPVARGSGPSHIPPRTP
jgi:hypothetical protein